MTAAVQTKTIDLKNPEKQNFTTWIVGNAFRWQTEALVEIQEHAPPDVAEALMGAFEAEHPGLAYCRLEPFRTAVDAFCTRKYMVQQDSAKGKHVVICGAGPSLRDTAAKWIPQADQVWGCNSALTWLVDNGYPVTHGFTVDQTAHMVVEWTSAPDVEYLVASTVHPHLSDHLRASGRTLTFFHNYVGLDEPDVSYDGESMPFEDWIYSNLFPPTIRVGSGLNTVTRAIDVAVFMGFSKITVLGADCALRVKSPMPKHAPFGSPEHTRWLREQTEMHADGGHALASEASPMTLQGFIDSGTPDKRVRSGHGRLWVTKPDMMISAVWLVRMKQVFGSRLRIMGDTLPKALMGKSDAYIKELPTLINSDGQPIEFL